MNKYLVFVTWSACDGICDFLIRFNQGAKKKKEYNSICFDMLISIRFPSLMQQIYSSCPFSVCFKGRVK